MDYLETFNNSTEYLAARPSAPIAQSFNNAHSGNYSSVNYSYTTINAHIADSFNSTTTGSYNGHGRARGGCVAVLAVLALVPMASMCGVLFWLVEVLR